MSWAYRVRQWCVLGLALALLVAMAAEPAWAAKKKRKGNSQKSSATDRYRLFRLEAIAERELANRVAQSWKDNAEPRIATAQSKLEMARAMYATAQSDGAQLSPAVSAARDRLQAIEETLLKALPDDAPYNRAQAALVASRAALNTARQRVLTDPNYLARYNAAKTGPDVATQLAEVRRQALAADAQYVAAEGQFRAAETLLEQRASEVFSQDGSWNLAVGDLRKLVVQMGETKERIAARQLSVMGAQISLRSSSAIAAAAAATIARNSAEIALIKAVDAPVRTKKKSNSSSPSPGNGSANSSR